MKRIAVTMNVKDSVYKNDRLNQNYIEYLQKLDIQPILIPNSICDPIEYCKQFKVKGIILTGGSDISRSLVNAPPNLRRGKSNGRDYVEWKLLEMALTKKLPVLGICRGMQFINIFFGGVIIYNIKNMINNTIKHVRNKHQIIITDSKFIKTIGSANFTVNSFHNHGIIRDVVAPDLHPFALCSRDDIIEGIYHLKYPIIGIQWHPERNGSTCEYDFKLVQTFFYKGKFW
ncbi:MAG: gamma-glutamyl-gamma-aminobutyrate hydrolase family protein [bacterium]